MEGYDVITADDEKVGHVTAEVDDHVIVQMGHLRRSSHVLPLGLVTVDHEQRQLRTALAKAIIAGAPEADAEGVFDHDEVGAYYGLGGVEEEKTEVPAASGSFFEPERDRVARGGR
jgi:hypothetical protein